MKAPGTCGSLVQQPPTPTPFLLGAALPPLPNHVMGPGAPPDSATPTLIRTDFQQLRVQERLAEQPILLRRLRLAGFPVSGRIRSRVKPQVMSDPPVPAHRLLIDLRAIAFVSGEFLVDSASVKLPEMKETGGRSTCIIAAFLVGLLWSGRHCAAPGSCRPSPHHRDHHSRDPRPVPDSNSGPFSFLSR